MNSIRVRFTRGEEVKFISHLDLMKVFERAIRRSGLPIAYSQGFNPHSQMVFGLPLSVGVTSDSEYADFELTQEIRPEQFMERLNKSLPEGIKITAAAAKETKANIMAAITGADYLLDIFLDETLTLKTVNEKLENLMRLESVKVLKEGKGAAKEIDIRPLILHARPDVKRSIPFGYENFKAAFEISAGFRAGNTANLRPELFIKALIEQAGIPVVASRVHRKELYVESNGRLADPLDDDVLKI